MKFDYVVIPKGFDWNEMNNPHLWPQRVEDRTPDMEKVLQKRLYEKVKHLFKDNQEKE